MAAQYIFFVLLVSISQRADSEQCFLKTESCDIIEGCVKLPTTTKKTAQETSDITTYLRDLEQSTSEKGTDRNISVQGVLTTEILIIILTLSGIVLVFGVCLCFIFYKYKSAAKEKKPPINQIIPSPPHNGYAIEMEERLYDLIDESNMIDDHHVQQMASVYLDVIDESINTMNYESQNKVILNFPSQSIPTAAVKHQENKNDSSSLLGSNSTSPNDEDRQETTEDYINPYQPVLKRSPPIKEDYLTIPPLHKIDSSFHDTTGEKEKLFMHPRQLKLGASIRHFDYENMTNFDQTNMYTNLSNIRKQESVSCKYLNFERLQTEMSSEQEVKVSNSTDDYRLHYHNLFKAKSESDIFFKHSFQK
ncbi:Hypothetical predicted protein [Mytilus galloprovincialis]|uniref:Uncharacterized protein n=1 Tax=Mytilus galloprovincialis TaxID=29158 RepID=A0A8B6GD07_MYTGA|nr:Hypothetical predicted protein [Mytilus galloprovincialis]